MLSASAQAPLDPRRRKLIFRCWHRGMRETDLLLGRFADARVATMTDDDVAALEALLEAPDPVLFSWIVGSGDPDDAVQMRIMTAIRAFHDASPTSEDG